MSRAAPFLSICIPTLNRLSLLKAQLEVLLPQAQRHHVEICISNNCSTDGTSDFLSSLTSPYPCLRYITQQQRIGLDENMGAALAMGSGRFLYPLGDDDQIPENTLELILREIEEDADLILQNGWYTDADLVPQSTHLPVALQGSYFSDPTAAFDNLWDKMPFGSFIAARVCFNQDVFARYHGTRHAYTGVVWESLAMQYRQAGRCKIKCNAEQTVLLRGGDKTWRKDAAIIFLYGVPHWFATLSALEEYQNTANRLRLRYIQDQTSFDSLLQYCAHCQLDKNLLALLSNEFPRARFYKTWLVSRLPALIANGILRVRHIPKRFLRTAGKKIRNAIVGEHSAQ